MCYIIRVQYENGAVFVPVCEKCGRFVKSDKYIKCDMNGNINTPNATCKKCGRVSMEFEGFY